MDQLSFIVRYVHHDGHPIERFLGFIKSSGHKAEELFTAVSEMLNKHSIDINNCRGQSYDNASNMSGKYTGLQTRVKEVNKLAVFIPCSAHSLNLVGTRAAECCSEALDFFRIIQKLYNFFSASTHRWDVLIAHVKGPVVKTLSNTRWSARKEAVKALRQSWKEIIKALLAIADDTTQKTVTRNEANYINRLEVAILTVFWDSILNRFNAVSSLLQSSSVDMSSVVSLYNSLVTFVGECRDDFDIYEEDGKFISDQAEYFKATSRKRKRTIQFGDKQVDQPMLNARDDFREIVFLPSLII